MQAFGNGVTAAVTLLAVLLGGWLTVRAQDRSWRRDHSSQWRDIRLAEYGNFLRAVREYVAYALDPTARIDAAPHPEFNFDMPIFAGEGRQYRQHLEAARTRLTMVAAGQHIIDAGHEFVWQARRIAADRGRYKMDAMPSGHFVELFAAQERFLEAARAELGLDSGTPLRMASPKDDEARSGRREPPSGGVAEESLG